MRRFTLNLESSWTEVKSLEGKWGCAVLARNELSAINHSLTDRVAQLKLENYTFKKSLETLKVKKPVPNEANTKIIQNKFGHTEVPVWFGFQYGIAI